MRIDDLEKRIAAQAQYTIEGAINLNVTGQLLVALIQAMLASKSMTPQFVNSVFDIDHDNTLARRGGAEEAQVSSRMEELTLQHLD
jgi:hypothetical protein